MNNLHFISIHDVRKYLKTAMIWRVSPKPCQLPLPIYFIFIFKNSNTQWNQWVKINLTIWIKQCISINILNSNYIKNLRKQSIHYIWLLLITTYQFWDHDYIFLLWCCCCETGLKRTANVNFSCRSIYTIDLHGTHFEVVETHLIVPNISFLRTSRF